MVEISESGFQLAVQHDKQGNYLIRKIQGEEVCSVSIGIFVLVSTTCPLFMEGRSVECLILHKCGLDCCSLTHGNTQHRRNELIRSVSGSLKYSSGLGWNGERPSSLGLSFLSSSSLNLR
uniref:Uncharacterized protein n=1 Tax=Hanusia phi TaxID=3032 RepID=A0A7S0NC89_9CRYP|mmetsp:Transcript_6011/g.13899  ORF Transcript_6011/g.13899 Transcript_6011/m.13899 type:complete len:120 (+) Transcript_6011:154-513(+)